MAFVINCVLDGMEYRGMQSGVGRESGRPWMSLIFETEDASQLSVSVPSDLQSEVYSKQLQKGCVCSISIRAVARADGQSYVQLTDLPFVIADADGELV